MEPSRFPDIAHMLEESFTSDLRYLMVVSHVVLTNNQITNRFIEREYDMPVQAWSSLYAVVTFPGLRARDIQALFPRPQNSISRAVALLARRGLVREEISATDARAKRLFPTPDGADLLGRIRAKVLQRQEEMFGALDDTERDLFLALCRKIALPPGLGRSSAMPLAE